MSSVSQGLNASALLDMHKHELATGVVRNALRCAKQNIRFTGRDSAGMAGDCTRYYATQFLTYAHPPAVVLPVERGSLSPVLTRWSTLEGGFSL